MITSCGPSYPTGTVDIEAAESHRLRRTLNNTVLSDRDGDGTDDTVKSTTVYSQMRSLRTWTWKSAYVTMQECCTRSPIVSKQVEAWTHRGGVFTAPLNDQYSFTMVMKDMLGDVLIHCKPASSAEQHEAGCKRHGGHHRRSNLENIQFLGGGFDAWGLSLDNNTLPYLDAPTAYAWVFGDNGSSNLKSPLRSYTTVGEYNATLRVEDRGGSWSETQIHPINVTDTSEPIPIITVNNIVIENEMTLLTDQRILFSAGRTVDNVPIANLEFFWDWGDGTTDAGFGAYSQQVGRY